MKKFNSYKQRRIVLIMVLLIVSLSIFSIASAEGCNPSISLVSQDPLYATPGSYVDLVFQVSGVANSECKGMTFQLLESYPFSLDESSIKNLSGSIWTSGSTNVWNIPCKVRIDSAALDGSSTIQVKYNTNPSDKSFFMTKEYNITIQDYRTSFDAVIQDVSGTDVVIALANVGKYSANSVVVRIPEQQFFKTTKTDGQMVGNLDSGDYTIVSFSLTQIMQRNQTTRDISNPNLRFDVYYTDGIGERRIVEMELPLKMTSTGNSSLSEIPGDFQGRLGQGSTKSIWNNFYIWSIISLIILIGVYFKFHSRINIFLRNLVTKRSKTSSFETPDWIKNHKLKEGKK